MTQVTLVRQEKEDKRETKVYILQMMPILAITHLCQGDRGKRGDSGEDGPKGAKGEPGNKGYQGEPGNKGSRGFTGKMQ